VPVYGLRRQFTKYTKRAISPETAVLFTLHLTHSGRFFRIVCSLSHSGIGVRVLWHARDRMHFVSLSPQPARLDTVSSVSRV
jgi:hypothetical protein